MAQAFRNLPGPGESQPEVVVSFDRFSIEPKRGFVFANALLKSPALVQGVAQIAVSHGEQRRLAQIGRASCRESVEVVVGGVCVEESIEEKRRDEHDDTQ